MKIALLKIITAFLKLIEPISLFRLPFLHPGIWAVVISLAAACVGVLFQLPWWGWAVLAIAVLAYLAGSVFVANYGGPNGF